MKTDRSESSSEPDRRFLRRWRSGLIVVDEEHESTYKSDFTPKYDTIEVACKRLQDRDSRAF